MRTIITRTKTISSTSRIKTFYVVSTSYDITSYQTSNSKLKYDPKYDSKNNKLSIIYMIVLQ